MGAIHLLERADVVRFVEEVRQRDGIISPTNRDALAYNRRRFPVERYIKEALPLARAYWEREVREDRTLGWVESSYRTASGVMRRLLGVRLPGVNFCEILRVEKLAESSARIIGRFVVADLLEVPQPINMPLGAVLRFPLDNSADVVVAVVAPGATVEDVDWRQLFLPVNDNYFYRLGRWLRLGCLGCAGSLSPGPATPPRPQVPPSGPPAPRGAAPVSVSPLSAGAGGAVAAPCLVPLPRCLPRACSIR